MSKVFYASDAREACESMEKIREVLLVGLASYGEIERLSNVQELCRNEIVPDDLHVVHPTGSADTVSDFAAALRNVDIVMRQIRDWAGQSPAPEKPEAPSP